MIRALPGRLELNYLPPSLTGLLTKIETSVRRVELGLSQNLADADGNDLRSKGVQALLLLLSAECAGGANDRSVSLATVVETIQAAARAHERVSDNDFIPSYGNQSAILLGDYLFANSFGALAANGNHMFVPDLTQVVARMCEGQVRFLRARGSLLSVAEYLDLLVRKVGSLAGFCASAGVQTAGDFSAMSAAFGAFGESFGVAFHLAGEIAELREGDDSTLARTLGPDSGFTLPIILAMQTSLEARTALLSLAGKTTYASEDLLEARRLLENSGAIAKSRELVEDWLRRALEQLAPIPETEAKRLLARVAVDLCRGEG